jgi:hypothetical protein
MRAVSSSSVLLALSPKDFSFDHIWQRRADKQLRAPYASSKIFLVFQPVNMLAEVLDPPAVAGGSVPFTLIDVRVPITPIAFPPGVKSKACDSWPV